MKWGGSSCYRTRHCSPTYHGGTGQSTQEPVDSVRAQPYTLQAIQTAGSLGIVPIP